MTLGVLTTTPGSLVPATAPASTRPVQPVQSVTRDRPAPDRRFDSTGGTTSGNGGSGLAALLLNKGGATAAGTPTTVLETDGDTAPKPNLDALNRVLAHYVAQSAAAARLKP